MEEPIIDGGMSPHPPRGSLPQLRSLNKTASRELVLIFVIKLLSSYGLFSTGLVLPLLHRAMGEERRRRRLD
jgi:hypothetical protein